MFEVNDRSYAVGVLPSAERYVSFFCSSVFALYERKNRTTATMRSPMLPQAKSR